MKKNRLLLQTIYIIWLTTQPSFAFAAKSNLDNSNLQTLLLISILGIIAISSVLILLFNLRLKRSIKTRNEELARTNETLSKEIEDRKASEYRENENFDRYKITFDQAAEAILLTNANGKILDFNKRAYEDLEYSRNEFSKLNIYDFEVGRSRLEIKRNMTSALKDGGTEYETRLKTKYGRIKDFLIKIRTIRLRGEICFLSLWSDITAIKKNEKKLLEREKQLQKLVAKIPYPLCIIDSNNEVELLNDKFTESFGYSVHDIGNFNDWWEQVCPDENKNVCLNTIQKVRQTRKEAEPEQWPLLCKNGDERSVELILVHLGDKIMIAMHDLTIAKEIEENLRIAKNKAEETNLAKTEFLANMSHEIRTPLNGVMGMLQLTQMTDLNIEQKKYVDTGISSAKSLLRILADILDLSKIESGKLDIEQIPFQLIEAVKPVIESFSQEVIRKGLDFSYEIWPDVPEDVVGDQVRIRQILYNLVGNAIKFTEKGSVRLEIYSLPAKKDENSIYLHFAVIDTGIGIKDDEMGYVFESFTQADTSHTRRFGGTGLGLSMVKRLVNLMGGSMVFSSELGVGTEVHVSINLQIAPNKELNEIQVETDSISETNHELNSILLVEDERINQMAISKLLEKNGYDVTCADNGEEALKIILNKKFDFVLMDIQMPVLNGIQTTEAIRNSPEFKEISKIPIIALTAHAMSGDREKFIQSGMDEYLPKPVDSQKLVSMLRNFKG